MKNAIEVIETTKRTRYMLKQVCGNMAIIVTGKVHKTEESARAEAETLNIKIDCIGDIYQITSPY